MQVMWVRRPEPGSDSFARRVDELVRMLGDSGSGRATGGVTGPEAGPRPRRPVPGPDIWICGMSRRSAILAGGRGLSFAYSEHLRRNASGGSDADGPAVLDAYRQACPEGAVARTCITCYGLCAASGEQARRLWSRYNQAHHKDLVPTFLGTPTECRRQLEQVADDYGADELALQCLADDLEIRLESYRLLSASWRRWAVAGPAGTG